MWLFGSLQKPWVLLLPKVSAVSVLSPVAIKIPTPPQRRSINARRSCVVSRGSRRRRGCRLGQARCRPCRRHCDHPEFLGGQVLSYLGVEYLVVGRRPLTESRALRDTPFIADAVNGGLFHIPCHRRHQDKTYSSTPLSRGSPTASSAVSLAATACPA